MDWNGILQACILLFAGGLLSSCGYLVKDKITQKREKKSNLNDAINRLEGLFSIYTDYLIYAFEARLNKFYNWAIFQITEVQNIIIDVDLKVNTSQMYETSQFNSNKEVNFLSEVVKAKKDLFDCLSSIGNLRKIEISKHLIKINELEKKLNLNDVLSKINNIYKNIKTTDLKVINEKREQISELYSIGQNKLSDIEKQYRAEFTNIKTSISTDS